MTEKIQQFYYKKNRLQQMRGFYYLVKEKSITKAAKIMGLTQSTITLQIQSLERDLGFQLLKRKGKIDELTETGKEFYGYCVPYVQGIDSLFETFTKNIKTKHSRINIAAHYVALSYLLPKYINKFSEKHPNIKIGIQNISSIEAIKRLINDEIDVAIYPNIEESYEFTS